MSSSPPSSIEKLYITRHCFAGYISRRDGQHKNKRNVQTYFKIHIATYATPVVRIFKFSVDTFLHIQDMLQLDDLYRTWYISHPYIPPSSGSLQLLLYTGLIHGGTHGTFVLNPTLMRSVEKLTRMVDKTMLGIGAQKVMMPVLGDKKLWQKSGEIGDPFFFDSFERFISWAEKSTSQKGMHLACNMGNWEQILWWIGCRH